MSRGPAFPLKMAGPGWSLPLDTHASQVASTPEDSSGTGSRSSAAQGLASSPEFTSQGSTRSQVLAHRGWVVVSLLWGLLDAGQ